MIARVVSILLVYCVVDCLAVGSGTMVLFEQKKNLELMPDTTIAFGKPSTAPHFSSYILTGLLELPLSDVIEPFAVFYDERNKRSRIDYHNGLVKTIQLGKPDTNKMLSFSTMSTEAVNKKPICYEVSGSADRPIRPQPGIPINLSSYKYIGETALSGARVSQWHLAEVKGNKRYTYDFYIDSTTNHPIRYEFSGFDTALDSFFDKQVIEYNFFVDTPPSDEMFQVGTGWKCVKFPSYDLLRQMQRTSAINKEQLTYLLNPLSEFLSNDPARITHDFINEKYEHFKRQYKTQYASEIENEKRKALFRHNVRFIESMNRAGLTYRLAVNHLADWTADELRTLRGFKKSEGEESKHPRSFKKEIHRLRDVQSLPESLDWRLYGAVGPVGDQKICGSDWAFGISSAVEAANYLQTGRFVKLSEQELIDCSGSTGNKGCEGGQDYRGYEWVKRHGLATEQDYSPYLGRFSTCHFQRTPPAVTITDWVSVTSGNIEDLKWALALNGPITLAVDATLRSFVFYAGGYYSDPKCAKTATRESSVNHSVVAVGYGKLNGRDYILLKNSWSTDWGVDGYMLIDASPDKNCGLMTAPPTFPIL